MTRKSQQHNDSTESSNIELEFLFILFAHTAWPKLMTTMMMKMEDEEEEEEYKDEDEDEEEEEEEEEYEKYEEEEEER